MIKRILRYVVIVTMTFAIVFLTHQYVLESSQLTLSYSLFKMYLFHAITSIIIYVMIEVVADKLPDQAGYAFLAAVFLKIGFFILLFNGVIFSEIKLELFQRLSLIVPLFLFLIIEAVAIAKLLNAKLY